MSYRQHSLPSVRARRTGFYLILGSLLVLTGLPALPAFASTVTSAVFTGGGGAVSVGGTLYAKQGAVLTLTVSTSADTRCVTVTGAATLPRQTSPTGNSSWTFTTTAPAGNGVQAFTVAASPNFNNNNCTGQAGSTQASYTLDNTGPVVSAALTPAANAAGWNSSDVTVRWTAADTGSGVSAAQPFRTETVTANGIATLSATGQADRLGNTGAAGSVTVRVDKAKPTITGTETRNADGTVTVTFACNDSNSGGGEPSGIVSCVADGTSPASSSRTVPAGDTVTGTATDRAGNTATASVTTTPSDKTAPTISGSVTPTPNAAGWNKSDATVTFACADETGGSGLASCAADGTSPSSASRTVSTETNGTTVSGTAKDNAGNTASSTVTVRVDKTQPTAAATRTPGANAAGWNNENVTVSFTCADAGAQASGVKTCSAPVTKTADGANQSASGSATDNADNVSALASVGDINIDKTAPSLAGVSSSAPNANGWYKDDVTIAWNATDALSGLVGAGPADTTITGEGTGLRSSASVSDKAGNTTTADSTAVQIDRTAPITAIQGTSNDWVADEVTVTLTASDGLSDVASTKYSVDGAPLATGTSFQLSTDGDHVVEFFSIDNAGNAEAARTAHVKIDRTAPTIGHVFTPASYVDGAWTNSNVSVDFSCDDQGGSGVASCTGDTTVTTEGENQQVVGTAGDGTGNSASDTAFVSIDKTPPTIDGSADRVANADGWYDDDVTVSFVCDDALSGVSSCSAPSTLGEGSNRSASGTATDNAGNTAGATVADIDIDKTAPGLTGSFVAGWHRSDVTVSWTCTDSLSGPRAQPAPSVVTGEGANLSAATTCTDRAGNGTTRTVSGVQIDRTAPATGIFVSGELHNGWYQAGIDVDLSASDNLSGVGVTYYSVDGGAAAAYSTAVSIVQDGTHTFTYWSVDNAGNVEDKSGNSVTLKIDKTPPALSGAATTAPNAKGWYSGDVTVDWTCSDATSGIDGTCPADDTITGEGDALSAAASVSDNAGNTTVKTVGGIKIDRTAPTTTSSVPAPNGDGWYGAAVQVTLTGHDNLSGVENTYYQIDGGAAQTYTGAFSYGTEGIHEITFWSKDDAGNVETAGAPITLRIDKTAPTTEVVNPISPDSGWFVTSGIPVAFQATDGNGSGVKATYYSIDAGPRQTYGEPFTADLATGVHTITYWSVDLAGNEESHESTNTLEVRVDTIAPTITGSRTPPANSYGWNKTNVDVTFTCTDADSGISGIAGCGPDQTVANEGASQHVQGDAQDVAGNKSSTTVGGINIDKTAPSLYGTATTDPNSGLWYKGNVTVAWRGEDGLSGIDPASQPANSVITGEGRNLGASASISDKAGNPGTGSLSGVNIDRTAPIVNGVLPTGRNAAGWYRGDVTVGFTCSDPGLADGSVGSGVATCPADKVLSGDGANQSVTSDPATDNAGNQSAGRTVGGINIDGHEPQTTADNQCTATNGYCTGSTATVVLNATDVGPSGVKEIRYSVNGGAEQVATGSTKSVSVPLSGTGSATVTYYSVDVAGNAERSQQSVLKYDNIAPTVTHTVNPKANAEDWNNSDVIVHFDATDTDPGSGVAAGSVTPDVTVSNETSGLVVNGSAKDTAGNTGTDSVIVKLDKTAPTITGSIVSGTLGNNGWYVSPVGVKFSCSDLLSGIAVCPDDENVVVSSNGFGQSVTRTAKDRADNSATRTVSGINIDNENPTITDVNVASGVYTLGAVPAATCTANDSFSGLLSCKVTVTGGANGVGTFAWTAMATDKAGNTSTQSGTYQVLYRFGGFLQPINDTAHQVGTATSVFKAGSTVPVKFQVRNAAGQVVQAATVPVWLTPVKGSPMSMPVDESVYSTSADSGTTYRYDATAQQYHFNWKTGTGGNYWRIGVRLDDGQTYYVNIGLR